MAKGGFDVSSQAGCPALGDILSCTHTDFVTKFLCFATKLWTLIGSYALILSIVNLKTEMKANPMREQQITH